MGRGKESDCSKLHRGASPSPTAQAHGKPQAHGRPSHGRGLSCLGKGCPHATQPRWLTLSSSASMLKLISAILSNGALQEQGGWSQRSCPLTAHLGPQCSSPGAHYGHQAALLARPQGAAPMGPQRRGQASKQTHLILSSWSANSSSLKPN